MTALPASNRHNPSQPSPDGGSQPGREQGRNAQAAGLVRIHATAVDTVCAAARGMAALFTNPVITSGTCTGCGPLAVTADPDDRMVIVIHERDCQTHDAATGAPA